MRGSKAMILAILGGLIVIAVGCAPAAEEGISGGDITPTSLPSTLPALPIEKTPTSKRILPGVGTAMDLAKRDLAERLGVSTYEIGIVSVEAVEWPDASLGCPKPGMMYAQVITPGYRIILEVGGKRYEYHSDWGKQVVLCAEEGKPAPPAITPPSVEGLVELARRDLAQRLGFSTDEIDVVRVMEIELPIQNLGCPGKREPGFTIPAFVMGYEIVLSAKGEEHVYHGHGARVVFCR